MLRGESDSLRNADNFNRGYERKTQVRASISDFDLVLPVNLVHIRGAAFAVSKSLC